MALELVTGLREKGYNVEVATSWWGNGDFQRRMQALGFTTHVMRLGFISASATRENIYMTAHQLAYWPILLTRYRSFLKTFAPDKVIHTNWHHLLLLLPFLKTDRDLFWVHEVFENKPQYRRVFHALAKRIGRFIAVSRITGKSLIELGVPTHKVVVIHNGIDDPAANYEPIKTSHPIIAIAGQIGPWKGHEELLDSFQRVIKEYPQSRLHIFGKGRIDYEAKLSEKVENLQLGDKVVWRGYVKDIPELYRGVTVIAVPSRFIEPFGMTALEAAFFQIPAVVSNRGGLLEIVEHGVTGLVFESGNTAELARALLILIKDPELRRKMGANARERALKRFNRQRFVQAFAEVLRSNA